MLTPRKILTDITLTFLITINGLNFANAKTQTIKVYMQPRSESRVTGTLEIFETTKGLRMAGTLTGFEPNSKHGFHIHENADCSAADAKSAGKHYNPENLRHGAASSQESHAGDLGNIEADKDGRVLINKTFADLILFKSKPSVEKHPVLNRSIVVHKNADDFKSQPSGAAGPRMACGEIVVTNP